MKDLIEALALFAKYTDAFHPTYCAHDMLYVLVRPSDVSAEDTIALERLSFVTDKAEGYFYSYRFGSA